MKRDADSYRLLVGSLGGAVLIVMTIVASMYFVTRRPVVVVTPAPASPLPFPNATTSAGGSGSSDSQPTTPIPELVVSRLVSVPDSNKPMDPAWESVAVVDIPMSPQQVAQPTLDQGTIMSLRVQSVRDDSRYAWRISWDKPLPAQDVDVGLFTDAVAIQFPLVDGAPYTMGGPGLPVRMLYWKAAWQRDVDEGFKGLAALYPNSHYDMYWFAEGKEKHASDGSTDNPHAQQFVIASKSNNPMTDYHRKHPIEELTAHGFGSGTHVSDTISRGRGVWKEGKWYVVIDRPIQAGDPIVDRFVSSPDRQMMAFAVWDGDHGNRGGKKQISNWIPLRLGK